MRGGGPGENYANRLFDAELKVPKMLVFHSKERGRCDWPFLRRYTRSKTNVLLLEAVVL